MDSVGGRVPPCNKEAETAVLGSILLDNDAFYIVDGIISSDDFFVENNKIIFKAMVDLENEKIPIDHVTLGNCLRKKGDLEKIGGAMALVNITDAVATSANVEHYAGIVREASGMRMVINSCQDVVGKGMDARNSDGMTQAIDRVVEASHYLSRTRMPKSMFGLGEGVLEMYRKVASGYRGIPLPWPTLDNMTVGMWPKTVTVFVGRPNTGKTFLGVVSAMHARNNDYGTLFVSPEMSKGEIAERFFAIESESSYKDIVRGKLSDFTFPKFQETINQSKTKDNLWVMDTEDDISPKGIEAAIRACKPSFVVIDSIYNLKIKGERRDRLLVALEWIIEIAKRLDFAACVFAQQNRAAELSVKKGGGSRLGTIALADEIGQDTHAIFAMEQNKDDRADGILNIRPLKIRRGYMSKEVVRLNWDWDRMLYSEIQDDEEEYVDEERIPF